MRLSELLTGLVLLAATTAAEATSILEGWKDALILNYENGDSLSINCTDGEHTCSVNVVVDARSFSFGSDALGGLQVLPANAILYAVQPGDRAAYFTFNVSVVCPEDTGNKVSPYECVADVAVTDGVPNVRVFRSQRTTVREPAPNNSFKAMPLRGTP